MFRALHPVLQGILLVKLKKTVDFLKNHQIKMSHIWKVLSRFVKLFSYVVIQAFNFSSLSLLKNIMITFFIGSIKKNRVRCIIYLKSRELK